jgi:hypothetical protein
VPDALFVPYSGSPLGALLRSRFSGRIDGAYVFLSDDGQLRLAMPRRRQLRGTVRPRLRDATGRRYEQMFRVHLAEQHGMYLLEVGGVTSPRLIAELQLGWRVHDPVQVVRRRLIDATQLVHHDVRERIEAVLARTSAQHDLPVDVVNDELRDPRALPDAGVTYWVGHVALQPEAGEVSRGRSLAGPMGWSQMQREDFEFFKGLIEEGPTSLAALWLAQDPGEVRAVLDWVCARPATASPLPQPTALDPTSAPRETTFALAGIFDELDELDRRSLRRAVATVLASSGPSGQRALERLELLPPEGQPGMGTQGADDDIDLPPAAGSR